MYSVLSPLATFFFLNKTRRVALNYDFWNHHTSNFFFLSSSSKCKTGYCFSFSLRFAEEEQEKTSKMFNKFQMVFRFLIFFVHFLHFYRYLSSLVVWLFCILYRNEILCSHISVSNETFHIVKKHHHISSRFHGGENISRSFIFK